MRRRLMGGSGVLTATLISLPDTVAGDVCFYDSATDSKVFYRLGEGEDTVPETCTPIGVTVIPASHDVYGTGECAVVSLMYMDCLQPAIGNATKLQMYWGSNEVDISENENYLDYVYTDNTAANNLKTGYNPTTSMLYLGQLPSDVNYVFSNSKKIKCYTDNEASYYNTTYNTIPSPYIGNNKNESYSNTTITAYGNSLSDFDGKNNTLNIVLTRGVKDYNSWVPAYNVATDYPAASCCNMYYTPGTNQGDWYLPANGELGYYYVRYKTITDSINLITNSQSPYDGSCKWMSSTENGSFGVWYISSIGDCSSSNKVTGYTYAVAFLRVPPPPTQANIDVTFDDNDSGALLTSNGVSADWIKGRRCLAKPQSDGSVSICYLDENNSELYHDGTTAADLSGAQGQWMTDIPEYWFYMDESVTDKHTLYLSPTEVKGWKHSRRVLVGVTEAVSVSGKLWSRKVSGGELSTGNLSSVTFHNYANAIGEGWDIIDYETHCKIGHLFYAKYLNKDCQTVIGTGEGSYTRTIGTTSSLGNNDGTTDTQISFLGIEDAWGGKYEWMGGIHRNSGTVYIYDGFQPDAVPTVDNRTETIPYGSSYYGCITKMQWGEDADMLPIAYVSDSNYSQGYFDYGGVSYSGWRVADRSGSSAYLTGGVAYLYFYDNSSHYSANIGSRIQYRGTINVVDDITTFELL